MHGAFLFVFINKTHKNRPTQAHGARGMQARMSLGSSSGSSVASSLRTMTIHREGEGKPMSFKGFFVDFPVENSQKSLRAPRLPRKGLKDDEACMVHFCLFSLIKHTKIELLKRRGLRNAGSECKLGGLLGSSSGSSVAPLSRPHHPQGEGANQ